MCYNTRLRSLTAFVKLRRAKPADTKAPAGNAEGAGLEPANAVIRTAVFKTAALPIMLTFQ